MFDRGALAALLAITFSVFPVIRGPAEPVRGIIVSCQTWGWEWGSDAMVDALHDVTEVGANWVAIHPYSRIKPDGSVSWRSPGMGEPAPEWLARPIREAQEKGLKICIMPHVAGWRSGWRWRGDITFTDEASWSRFFETYTRFITELIRLCPEADAFIVGSELDRTIHREFDWRQLIARARALTTNPLSYCANWPDYQRVPFWDALDVIGISAYFPLAKGPAAPNAETIDQAWDRHLGAINAFSKRHDRPVVFLELGYDLGTNAARTPWIRGDGQPGGADLQELCLERALLAVDRSESVIGAFLWKWFPGDPRREEFSNTAARHAGDHPPPLERRAGRRKKHGGPARRGLEATGQGPTLRTLLPGRIHSTLHPQISSLVTRQQQNRSCHSISKPSSTAAIRTARNGNAIGAGASCPCGLPTWISNARRRFTKPFRPGWKRMFSATPDRLLRLSRRSWNRWTKNSGGRSNQNGWSGFPGLVRGLNLACRAIGSRGDSIATLTPVYSPFLSAPRYAERNLNEVPMLRVDNRWEIDWDHLETSFTARTGLFTLCNPHNPVGRVYRRDELERLAEMCLRHDLIVCSDEVHCELILDPITHTPMATLSPEIARRSITLMSPSKTFNTAGIACGFAIIPDAKTRVAFKRAGSGILAEVSCFGFTACEAAYRNGETWRLALLDRLRANRDRVIEFVRDELPGVETTPIEATYLAWLNIARLHLDDPVSHFERHGVGLTGGSEFGDPDYARLNFACPRETLERGLEGLKRGVAAAGS